MILPYRTFEALIIRLIGQKQAEEDLCSGFAKYNSDYGPYLEMPLTTKLPDILSDLYEDNTDYPAIDWWLYEGKFDKETMTNPEAIVYYNHDDEPETQQIIRTIHDLWLYMEKQYKENHKCPEC